MAGLEAIKTLIFLACINRLNADPVCTQELTALGPNVVCTAGAKGHVLRRGLVSDNNSTTRIILSNCRITRIDPDAFIALPSLELLDLSQNYIGTLIEGLFEQTPYIKKLNLSENKLEEIKPQVFDPLTRLSTLDLSNNLILGRNLEATTLERCPSIEHLDFSGNSMIGTQEIILQALQMLKTLKLNRCSLQEAPSFATRPNLSTMTRLTMSSNQITRLHDSKVFDNLMNLEYLELDGNLIDFIHEDVFKSLKNVKAISLQNNKITRLPETLFNGLLKLGNINLSHNLIGYVPVNAFRHTKLKNLNLADNKFTYLQDNFCLELRNSGVRLRKFFFNQNPWQCACLNDILVEMKKIGVEYNGAMYGGKLPVCVTTREFKCKRHLSFNEEYLDMYNEIIRK